MPEITGLNAQLRQSSGLNRSSGENELNQSSDENTDDRTPSPTPELFSFFRNIFNHEQRQRDSLAISQRENQILQRSQNLRQSFNTK